jgi:hypothetical protein
MAMPFDGPDDLLGFTLLRWLFLLLGQSRLCDQASRQGRNDEESLPHDEFSTKTKEADRHAIREQAMRIRCGYL